MSDVTIYHNPACGTSRNALALLREKGVEPTIVEYLKAGWTKAQLEHLFRIMGVSAHTVDAYLRRIFLKLGTTDRVTAAIRGVGSGIITGVV